MFTNRSALCAGLLAVASMFLGACAGPNIYSGDGFGAPTPYRSTELAMPPQQGYAPQPAFVPQAPPVVAQQPPVVLQPAPAAQQMVPTQQQPPQGTFYQVPQNGPGQGMTLGQYRYARAYNHVRAEWEADLSEDGLSAEDQRQLAGAAGAIAGGIVLPLTQDGSDLTNAFAGIGGGYAIGNLLTGGIQALGGMKEKSDRSAVLEEAQRSGYAAWIGAPYAAYRDDQGNMRQVFVKNGSIVHGYAR